MSMMTWERKTHTPQSETLVTRCNVSGYSTVNNNRPNAAGTENLTEGGRAQMQTKTKDMMHYTVKDYAEELSRLIEQEQEQTARILRRIDASMDVIYQAERLLKK